VKKSTIKRLQKYCNDDLSGRVDERSWEVGKLGSCGRRGQRGVVGEAVLM
jgi:hypothetical protein